MSSKRAHFIPHPLCQEDQKVHSLFVEEQKKEPETLGQYIQDSSNPRWAASFIVRSVANGLFATDPLAAGKLNMLADELASGRIKVANYCKELNLPTE